MIAPSIVEEVKRLLAQGKWSGRKIARMAGVSRGSVAAIAHGRRPDYEAQQKDREEEEKPLGPLGRCSGCGGMVHLPCRLCSVRKRVAQPRPRRRISGTEEIARVGLLGVHLARYEEIRRRRIAEELHEERGERRGESEGEKVKDNAHG